jgi:plasmid stability protein
MKRITVSIDDETHRLAKVKAAEKGTSVSAMVRDYLVELTSRELAAEDLSAAVSEKPEKTLSEVIADLRAKGVKLSSADNVPREELYDRDALR